MRHVVAAVLLAFLFVLSANLHSQQSSGGEQPVLTFVQITDAHVFDEGWTQPVHTGYAYAGDDWASFHWAIGKINELARGENKIDFVLFTGDFGLENVQYQRVIPPKTACDQLKPIGQGATEGLPVIPREWAAKKMAEELNTLAINKVYVVPGNNDFFEEKVTDIARFGCFLDDLKSELAKSSAVDVEELQSSQAIASGKFSLLGFNTGFFKKSVDYVGMCKSNQAGCPDTELQRLQTQVNAVHEDKTVLLFTHVPDLMDPYLRKESWNDDDFGKRLRPAWQTLACDPKVLGIFAGHFHDSDRNLYGSISGTRNLTVADGRCVAEKTWVAPPLAIKNQGDKNPRARGLLLVKIFADKRIDVQPYWYGDCAATAETSAANGQSCWTMIWILIAIALLGFFIVAIKSGMAAKKRDSAQEKQSENAPQSNAMGDERKFIEDLVGQRFNFFIVFFSLIAGGAVSAKNPVTLKIVLIVGTLIAWMITYTLVIAQIKLEHILEKLGENHPYQIIQHEVGLTGRKWIGIWIPVFCSLILTIGMFLALCGSFPGLN